ncbi:MAG: methylamine utilization protein [Steroidobacteraceae bacterium]
MKPSAIVHWARTALTGRSAIAAAALCALSGLAAAPALAADLTASIVDSTGHPVAGVVVVAESDTPAPDKHQPHSAIMDQQHMQFVPRILVVQTGTAVDFPNSDQIQHQVYSFSPAKIFKLSLYAGHKYPPVVFDRPGLVTLGCNIHDGMIGYIYVTDSPFFGRSDSSGKLQLHGMPPGNYTLTAWHPQMQEAGGNSLTMRVLLAEGAHATPVFHLSQPVHTEAPHSGDTRWADY